MADDDFASTGDDATRVIGSLTGSTEQLSRSAGTIAQTMTKAFSSSVAGAVTEFRGALELTIECAVLWTVLVHEFWTGDLQTINALTGATALLVAYWGFRFGVLGVYISGRTREKIGEATGQAVPGVLGQLAKAVLKKK